MESAWPTPSMGESFAMKNAYLHVRYRGSIRRSRRCHVLRLGYRSNRQDLRTPALRIPRRPPSGRHPIRQDTWPTAAAPSCRGDRGRPPRSTRRSGQEHHLADSPCFPGVTAKAYPTSSSVPFSCFADLVAPSSVSHSIEPQCGKVDRKARQADHCFASSATLSVSVSISISIFCFAFSFASHRGRVLIRQASAASVSASSCSAAGFGAANLCFLLP
ncbi:hypothetical protein BHM03_00023020 [Ensete ventricosum]|nr:hypothetical protein BHM03_00023020 [Ensete ventricosum]